MCSKSVGDIRTAFVLAEELNQSQEPRDAFYNFEKQERVLCELLSSPPQSYILYIWCREGFTSSDLQMRSCSKTSKWPLRVAAKAQILQKYCRTTTSPSFRKACRKHKMHTSSAPAQDGTSTWILRNKISCTMKSTDIYITRNEKADENTNAFLQNWITE